MPDIDRIGKYEIRREIGRGAMGVVYEAYDPLIKRLVALKTIRPDQLAGEDAEAIVARFRREAQAAGRLNHPNIVAIYDFGEEAGLSYIAMEFVHGRELKTSFEAGERFRLDDIVRIMTQILSALDCSHRQGVIHRDVKPANIFLLDDGTVKVADFGIAHLETSNLTQVGTVLGTPSYMSPEQILGLPVDGRSDVFSAGVILYQFLTGERPFAGSSTTTMQKVLKEEPLAPSTLNVQLLPVMDAVVRKAMAKQADSRFQTAREFADAIRAAAATGPGKLMVQPTNAEAAEAAEATIIASHDRSPEQSPAAASTGAAARAAVAPAVAAVGVAALVVMGAGTWFIWQRANTAATTEAPSSQAVAAAASRVSLASPPPSPAQPVAAATEPGMLAISAVGLIDPGDSRYKGDKALQQADARADAKREVIAKTLGLLLDANSLNRNYDLLEDRLLDNSGSYIERVVQEGEPQVGQDGLMAVTTEAVVNVKALQKSLNEMSRDERVELIRASGDPKVSVQIAVRDADAAEAPPIPSPVAENILKERIKSFGFRTWREGGADAGKGADFAVAGQAQIKRLSMRLPSSGLVVTKYALTSWTVKCIDLATGEEIYHNTTLPKGTGSFASEEEALQAIGTKMADAFSRDFFLQHANIESRQVALAIDGMPDVASEDALGRDLVGLPVVIAVTPGPPEKPRVFELELGGNGATAELVAGGVLKPLNAKLGQSCFALGTIDGDRVDVVFDKRCTDRTIVSRLDANPPAWLYGASPARQKRVIKDPAKLRKLMI